MAPSGTSPGRNPGSSCTKGPSATPSGTTRAAGNSRVRVRYTAADGSVRPVSRARPGVASPETVGNPHDLAPHVPIRRAVSRIRRSDPTDDGPDVRELVSDTAGRRPVRSGRTYPVETSDRSVRRHISPATTASSKCPSRRPGPLFHPTIPPSTRRSVPVEISGIGTLGSAVTMIRVPGDENPDRDGFE